MKPNKTIPKDEVLEIIKAEYAYWKDVGGSLDTMLALGALANVMCAVIIYPRKPMPKGTGLVDNSKHLCKDEPEQLPLGSDLQRAAKSETPE